IPAKDYPLLVRKVLKSLWFVTSHTNQIRRYRLKSFGRSATEHKFVKNEGEQTTVADYFNDKWNIRLRHPHLPVVELFNPAIKNQSCFLPMELVTVDEWQRSLKPLTTDQQAKVTKKTVVRPGERYGMIRRVADERGFNNDSYLSKFGITVDVNEMVMLRARILPPPEIKYKSAHGDQREVVERVQIGKWWLNNRFNKAREIRAWAVILVSQREPDNRQIRLARDFASKIPQAMSKYGIRFNSSPIEKSDAAVPQTILARMNELKMHGCEVIIYILNQVGDDIYHAIKFFGNVKIDTIIGIIHYRKIGDAFSMAHHLVSIYAFVYVLTLNVMPYFANFRLLAELSTPSVNFRWFLDALKYPRRSKAFILNGLFMTIVFFFVRIFAMPIYWWKVYTVAVTPLWSHMGHFRFILIIVCVVLDVINLYWFSKMFRGCVKTLTAAYEKKKD
ncbi:unnamed protein product, partial [Rotaria sp. Silwood2]